MKVSHRCPACAAYNNIADGVMIFEGGLVFECKECEARWTRAVCDTCKGSGFFLSMPCDCDGGMEWEPKIEYTSGTKRPQGKPTFGQKSKPEEDFSL